MKPIHASDMYHISGTFDGLFNLVAWRFFVNCQTEVTANIIFKRTLWQYLMVMLGQSAKLNTCQSLFVAKSPNLSSAECTAPMV